MHIMKKEACHAKACKAGVALIWVVALVWAVWSVLRFLEKEWKIDLDIGYCKKRFLR